MSNSGKRRVLHPILETDSKSTTMVQPNLRATMNWKRKFHCLKENARKGGIKEISRTSPFIGPFVKHKLKDVAQPALNSGLKWKAQFLMRGS